MARPSLEGRLRSARCSPAAPGGDIAARGGPRCCRWRGGRQGSRVGAGWSRGRPRGAQSGEGELPSSDRCPRRHCNWGSRGACDHLVVEDVAGSRAPHGPGRRPLVPRRRPHCRRRPAGRPSRRSCTRPLDLGPRVHRDGDGLGAQGGEVRRHSRRRSPIASSTAAPPPRPHRPVRWRRGDLAVEIRPGHPGPECRGRLTAPPGLGDQGRLEPVAGALLRSVDASVARREPRSLGRLAQRPRLGWLSNAGPRWPVRRPRPRPRSRTAWPRRPSRRSTSKNAATSGSAGVARASSTSAEDAAASPAIVDRRWRSSRRGAVTRQPTEAARFPGGSRTPVEPWTDVPGQRPRHVGGAARAHPGRRPGGAVSRPRRRPGRARGDLGTPSDLGGSRQRGRPRRHRTGRCGRGGGAAGAAGDGQPRRARDDVPGRPARPARGRPGEPAGQGRGARAG